VTHSPSDFHQSWVAELTRLEVDVALAEQLLAESHHEPPALPEWQPPAVRGPLPADLEPRARLVLERQVAVAYLIAEKLTVTHQHRRLTQRIRDTAGPDIPVYIDVSA
jgi:hypothetical protein